jgi:hypothetical protein
MRTVESDGHTIDVNGFTNTLSIGRVDVEIEDLE